MIKIKIKNLNKKKEFKKQFICLRENTEKCITFTVAIEKEITRIDKNGEEITKNISYILQFIDIARLIVSSLSNLVNSLSEGIHRVKCKYEHDDKKHCDCVLEYTNFKDDLIERKCSICNKNCQIKFVEKLNERFFNAYKFSNHKNFVIWIQIVSLYT